jgi:hypothetical protein
MGWGNTGQEHRPDARTWPSAELNAAAAVGAAQLPAAGLIWWVGAQLGDDYGVAEGGALGLLCLFVLSPLVLPALGFGHAVLHTMPADRLERLLAERLGARHARVPRWFRHLVCAAVLGAAWAVPTALLGAWPYPATALVLAALGVLPVLGLARVRGRARTAKRARGLWSVWFRSGFVSVGLCVLVLAGGAAATATGLLKEYEPPKLSAAQLTGVWRGADGAVLRLSTGGRAEARGLPAEPDTDVDTVGHTDLAVCDGPGTWLSGTKGGYDPYLDAPEGRDGVLVRLDGGCGQDTYWRIGGTERDPELFVPFGDPDSPDLRILKRD